MAHPAVRPPRMAGSDFKNISGPRERCAKPGRNVLDDFYNFSVSIDEDRVNRESHEEHVDGVDISKKHSVARALTKHQTPQPRRKCRRFLNFFADNDSCIEIGNAKMIQSEITCPL